MQKVSREKQVSPSGAGSHTLRRDLNIELWNKDPANNGGKREVFNDLKTQFGRSALSGLGIRMLGGKSAITSWWIWGNKAPSLSIWYSTWHMVFDTIF